jgi:hypothetical protein
MCHTRELAFQISKEYERFSKFMTNIKVTLTVYHNVQRSQTGNYQPDLMLVLYLC